MYAVDLPSEELAAGSKITFTFYWSLEQRWENVNYTVVVE
jgi:hypothetical protein